MKLNFKNLLAGAALLYAGSSFAQLHDEKSVTVTMDLQPILQLDMETSDQIEFVFDDIRDYYAGITQYSSTILKVSSTVSWDLYAIGRSNGANGSGFWDQVIEYGNGSLGNPNAIVNLPLSLLELRQSTPNNGAAAATGAFADYNTPFPAVSAPAGSNSLYYDGGVTGVTPPTAADKYIAGHFGQTAVTQDAMAGGSYLTEPNGTSDYFYVIDYRILPGLPAVFPNSFQPDGTTAEDLETANGVGSYAQPGVYTMYVQYVLTEDI